MGCRRFGRRLPLLAGGELPESKARALLSHLKKCSRCREEYEKYVRLVRETRTWLAENRLRWENGEWRRLAARAASGSGRGKGRKPSLVSLPVPRAWALALAVGGFFLVAALVLLPPFGKKIGLPFYGKQAPGKNQTLVPGEAEQDVMSLTMVSKESGLKIVWIFNRHFNLEEKK